MWKDRIEFSELVDKVLTEIHVNDAKDEIVFICDDGTQYLLHHLQDCCESVRIEDIEGELDDLIGVPILIADEASSTENPKDYVAEFWNESFTWTFYKLATIKGYVTIRWYGSSNGYYSERVDFVRL